MRVKRNLLAIIGVTAAVVLAVAGASLALEGSVLAQTSLPAPANVQVVNGDTPGEVVVSWDAATGASGYSIRWFNYDATWDAFSSGHDGQNLILSSDVQGGETTTHTLTVSNPDTGVEQYWFAVGSRSGPDAELSWSGWETLDVQGDPDEDVLVLAAAQAISRNAGALVALSSTATRFGMTQADLDQLAAGLGGYKVALEQQLNVLVETDYAERVGRIESLAGRLVSNAESIEAGRGQLLSALDQAASDFRRLRSQGITTLVSASVTSVDNQFYRLVTSTDSDDLSENDILRYSHVSTLSQDLINANRFLTSALQAQDHASFISLVQQLFNDIAERMTRSVEYLEDPAHAGAELHPELLQASREALALGTGENNYFDRAEQRIGLLVAQNTLVAENAEVLNLLLTEIDGLVAEVQGIPAPAVPPPPSAVPPVPGVTDNSITFGQSAAFMGPAAELGIGMRLGIQAAFAEANRAGGVHNRALVLVSRNDGYESDLAFENSLGMITSGQVFGLIGAVGSPTSEAVLPLVSQFGVPFVAPFTGAQFLRDPELTNVLNVRASYYQETERLVAQLQEQGKSRVAVLYQNDTYGRDGLAGVRLALESRQDMELVESWYYRRNTSAVLSAAYTIEQSKPDAVIIIGAYQPAAEAIGKLQMKLESDTVFMNVSFVGSRALAGELGADGEGVYVSQVVPSFSDTSIPVVASYRAALEAYYPEAEPGFVSLEGYLAGRLAIQRLENCGDNPNWHCFLDVSDSPTIDIDGFTLEFAPGDNQGSDEVFLTVLGADGQYSQVE